MKRLQIDKQVQSISVIYRKNWKQTETHAFHTTQIQMRSKSVSNLSIQRRQESYPMALNGTQTATTCHITIKQLKLQTLSSIKMIRRQISTKESHLYQQIIFITIQSSTKMKSSLIQLLRKQLQALAKNLNIKVSGLVFHKLKAPTVYIYL
jgi:hypothetical protein